MEKAKTQKFEVGKFSLELSQKGYALNRMCHSLNNADNRATFSKDEEAYCTCFGLNEEERAAVASRDRDALLAAGGNMYFLAKLDRTPRRSSNV